MRLTRTTWIAVALVSVVVALSLVGAWGDSAIFDEVAHLPAGYTYVTRGDMRLNPEHPPLTKDLAGLSLLAWSKLSGTPVHVPDGLPAWTSETNGQWDFGPALLYRANDHSRAMLFWGRFPTVVLLAAFALLLFTWVRRRFGNPTALLALTLTCLSPTVLAHAHFVTTDLAAAFAYSASVAAFLAWLERPTWRRVVTFGVVLGLAELTKFSLILLLPLFPALIVLKLLVSGELGSWRARARQLGVRITQYGLVLVVAFGLVVMPIYALHTFNEPVARQQQDLEAWRGDISQNALAPFVFWSADKPVLRSFGYYITGILLVQNRSHYGSTTFFLGAVSSGGRSSYFPLLYLVKEPLAFHLLTLAALAGGVTLLIRARRRIRRLAAWLNTSFVEVTLASVIGFYWWTSVHSQLNIGIRHLLPVLPLTFVLVSRGVVVLGQRLQQSRPRLYRRALVGVAALLAWQAVSVLRVSPGQLAYFNELAGGPEGGVRIVADSNLDWGQDLNRLASYVRERGITSLALDYFGGGDPQTALPGVAYTYHVDDGPVSGWLAVSRTYLANERGQAGRGVQKPPNRYAWLDAYTPVAIIGHSIVVYSIAQ